MNATGLRPTIEAQIWAHEVHELIGLQLSKKLYF